MTAPSEIRVLGAEHRDALQRFLERDPDRTLFLRHNLERAGIEYTGELFSATYVGLLEGARVRAVAAHCWNGIVLIHAGAHVDALVTRLCASTSRAVSGLVGPWDQVARARQALGLQERRADMDSRDVLMTLALDALEVPALISDPDSGVRVRRAAAQDLDVLVEYRVAYHMETLGRKSSPDLPDRVRRELLPLMDEDAFVLEADGAVRACTFFNARAAGTVQVGGVFTPPGWRGRGYGRAVVAGSLIDARAHGATRSVLFTSLENHAAQRAYRALGYQDEGEYGLILFA